MTTWSDGLGRKRGGSEDALHVLGGIAASDIERAASDVAAALERGGLHAALAYLNARARCRFTGAYRAEPPLLRNVRLFDRENPTLHLSGAVSRFDETYCAMTCAADAPFVTPDAGRDPRLATHPARESVLCYAGVPLRLASGRVWGTLCHFDVRPRFIGSAERRLLEAVSPAVAQWLLARAD